MYYLQGEQSCIETILAAINEKSYHSQQIDFQYLKNSYSLFLKGYQPDIPVHNELRTHVVSNRRIENRLIDTFRKPSILDDLEQYSDFNFLQNGNEFRGKIRKDVAFLRKQLLLYEKINPDFWRLFQIIINYIICPVSEYSNGGSDSNFIGMLFISSPSTVDYYDLYELLVHEFTHNMMFLDEIRNPHYTSDELIALKNNYAIASISGKKRPLDKVLHSIVIATEVMLHRELVLGHDHETLIHPDSKKLRLNLYRSIESIRALKSFHKVMGARGRELLELCYNTLEKI